MELKKLKFKDSFYGQIPEDWIDCEFKDVLEGFSSGMTPYRAIPEYYSGNIPWITSGELNYNKVVDTLEKITPEAVSKTNLKILPVGTFLMAITGLEAAGTRGSCAITGVKATTNQSCMALYPQKGKTITEYLYHFYVHRGDELAFKFCQGSKQQSYTGKIAKLLPIILPPTLEEQKAIATALSDVDELITNLDKLITKKKAIKQGAMQQLLTPPHKGGKRLEGFTGEWVEKTLGELFDFKTTSTKKQFFDLSGNLIVMDMGSVSIDGKILRSKKASCDFDILKKGDLVMPKDDIGGGNIIGKVAFIDKDNSYVLSDHVFRLNSINDKINSLYFYYLINSRIVNESILKVVSGSAQLGLGLNIIKKITVCYNSDKSQQKAIAQILSDMDLEIEQLESKKAKYQSVKLGMMQELLTGKTRLV